MHRRQLRYTENICRYTESVAHGRYDVDLQIGGWTETEDY